VENDLKSDALRASLLGEFEAWNRGLRQFVAQKWRK